MKKESITIDSIKNIFKRKNYEFFENGDYNLNIIGIRTGATVSNVFDDFIVVIFKAKNKWTIKIYSATTDPGLYWINNPIKVEGTAILVPGQYRGAYSIGIHKGYKALVQSRNVKVYRDPNKDEILNFDSKTIQEGSFGINIHRAMEDGESTNVNKWSAGCQVFASSKDFDEFMNLCETSKINYGGKFTYTLIEERDFLVPILPLPLQAADKKKVYVVCENPPLRICSSAKIAEDWAKDNGLNVYEKTIEDN